jgi:hypothetical protein
MPWRPSARPTSRSEGVGLPDQEACTLADLPTYVNAPANEAPVNHAFGDNHDSAEVQPHDPIRLRADAQADDPSATNRIVSSVTTRTSPPRTRERSMGMRRTSTSRVRAPRGNTTCVGAPHGTGRQPGPREHGWGTSRRVAPSSSCWIRGISRTFLSGARRDRTDDLLLSKQISLSTRVAWCLESPANPVVLLDTGGRGRTARDNLVHPWCTPGAPSGGVHLGGGAGRPSKVRRAAAAG